VSKEITLCHENRRKNNVVLGSGGLLKALPSFILDRTEPSTSQTQAQSIIATLTMYVSDVITYNIILVPLQVTIKCDGRVLAAFVKAVLNIGDRYCPTCWHE
jgi:hypothetical protein